MLPSLSFLSTLARDAGEILRAGYLQEHVVHHKGRVDLVTEIDHASEALIVERIHQAYPDHHILTEEAGALGAASEHTWYIDPLDGTVNYAHGLPAFCVSIAYARAGQVVLGAIYDPTRDQLFTAEHNAGAWLGDVRLQVAGRTQLVDALLMTGFPYDAWTGKENNLKWFDRFTRLSTGVRRLGSCALDLCYIAAGWLDGFWEVRISPWDIAAGALLVTEAGGIMTKIDGSPDILIPPCSVLAANPTLHALMLEEFQKE